MSGKNQNRPVQIFLDTLSECTTGQLTTHNSQLTTHNSQLTTHNSQLTTHNSQLQVVLMGDAAHTMTPILGQGLNCGLEDVAAFSQILEQHQGNVDTALPAYNTARWPDVEALLNINELVANKDNSLDPQVYAAARIHWYTCDPIDSYGNMHCKAARTHTATGTDEKAPEITQT